MIYFERSNFLATCAGHDTEPILARQDIDGVPTLVPIGTRHIQQEIDSNAPPAIMDILNRAMRGDPTALQLNANRAQYGDVSEINDLGQIYKASQNMEKFSKIVTYTINAEKDHDKELKNDGEST